MSITRKSVLFAALAALLAVPAQAKDIAFTGFGFIFSPGVCSMVRSGGECTSYLLADGAAERYCRERPQGSIRVAGHSMGAGGATTFVKAVVACGLKVEAVVLLDPMVWPFGLPKGVRVKVFCTPSSGGICEGRPEARRAGGLHITMASDSAVRDEVARFFEGER